MTSFLAKFRPLLAAGLTGLMVHQSGLAATKVLTLSVSGSIIQQPEWQDDTSAVITAVALSFAGILAGTVAATAVDSATSNIRLITGSYPATVAMIRPQTCALGVNNVANNNVHFLFNGTAYTANGNLTFGSSATQTIALRFAAAGNHGMQSGAVTCAVQGSLTYTY